MNYDNETGEPIEEYEPDPDMAYDMMREQKHEMEVTEFMETHELKGSVYFNSHGTNIGIVLLQNKATLEYKSFIGTVFNVQEDDWQIALNGVAFPVVPAKQLISIYNI